MGVRTHVAQNSNLCTIIDRKTDRKLVGFGLGYSLQITGTGDNLAGRVRDDRPDPKRSPEPDSEQYYKIKKRQL